MREEPCTPTTPQGPLPQYAQHPYYRALVNRHTEALTGAQNLRVEISVHTQRLVKASPLLAIATFLQKSFGALGLLLGGVACIAGCVAAYSPRRAETESAIGTMLISGLAGLATLWLAGCLGNMVDNARKKIESGLVDQQRERLQVLDAAAATATQEVLASWDHFCVSYPGYPPDWSDRSQAAKQRDREICQQCGWPHGFVRRVRNLHAHHRLALHQGGNNAMDNLVTLCHICHREKGGGHNRIKYRPADQRRGFRSRWR